MERTCCQIQLGHKRKEIDDMTEKDHYKYGLSGDKVPVELAERFRARIRALEAALAKLDTTAKYLGDCNARNADKANRLEAALRQSRPYVYNAEVADAADLEARYCVLSVIDALLPQTETSAQREGKST